MATAQPTRNQTDHAIALLHHVYRYRLTVIEALERHPELRKLGRGRIKRLLRELCDADELGREKLYHNRPYYHLPLGGSEMLEDAGLVDPLDERCGPHSERSKIHNFAALAFCCLGRHRRERLTAADLEQYVPQFYRPGLPLNYYIDTSSDAPRLGYLRIDTAGRGRWDRVVSKCRHDMEKHSAEPALKEFIRRELFEITLITTLPQKAQRIERTLDEWNDPRRSLIRTVAMPELLYLVAPPPS